MTDSRSQNDSELVEQREQLFRARAGVMAWPRNLDDLTSTSQCPACLSALRSAVCDACGLDLNHPSAAQLAEISTQAAALLGSRVSLIGRIRVETEELAASRATTAESVAVASLASSAAPLAGGTVAAPFTPPIAPAVAAPIVPAPIVPVDLAPIVPSPTTTLPPVAPTAGQSLPPQSTTPAKPRRSSVQLTLLVTGILLLSVFAIFAIVYAFINYGVVWRSIIIGAVTIATFVAASMLRKRSLAASAEGVGVLALVLFYLDAFALRANDFFGLASSDGRGYWGVVLLISAVVLVAWHRLAGIRSASIVGFGAFAPGVGLLTSFLLSKFAENLDAAPHTVVVLAAVAAAALVIVLIPRPASTLRPAFLGTSERAIVAATAGLALFGAAPLAFLAWEPGHSGAATLSLVVFGLIAGGLAVILGRRSLDGLDRGAALAFAGYAGAVVAASGAAYGWREAAAGPAIGILLPVVVSCLVAAALVLLWRSRTGFARATARAAALLATIVAGITALPALGVTLARLADYVLGALIHASDSSLETPSWLGPDTFGVDTPVVAVLALLCVLLIGAALAGATSRLGSVLPALAAGCSAVVLLAVPLAGALWLAIALWLSLAVVALIVLISQARRQLRSRLRGALIMTVGGATTLAWLSGITGAPSWLAVSLAAIAIVLGARFATSSAALRAGLLSIAIVLTLITVAITMGRGFTSEPLVTFATLALVCAALLAISSLSIPAMLLGRFASTLDRRVTFWLAAAMAIPMILISGAIASSYPLGALGSSGALFAVGLALCVASGVVLIAASALWMGRETNRSLTPERYLAMAALAPALAWTLGSLVALLARPDLLGGRLPIETLEAALQLAPIAAVVVAAAALLAHAVAHAGEARWPGDVGAALLGAVAVLAAVFGSVSGSAVMVPSGLSTGWLVLLLAAVATLLLSTSADGLVGSVSPRRYLIWLALAFAMAGLWWCLAESSVTALEPYLLPLTAAMLLIAALMSRTERHAAPAAAPAAAPHSTGSAVPTIVLAALVVSIVPLSLVAAMTPGEQLRSAIMLAVSIGLLLCGSLIPARPATRAYLDAAALSGGIGTLIISAIRGFDAADAGAAAGLTVEAWILPGVAALVVAALGQSKRRPENDGFAKTISTTLIITAIVLLAAVELRASLAGGSATLRLTSVVVALSALHVLAFRFDRVPFTARVSWVSLGVASALAVFGFGMLSAPELGTVPIALALLATGAMHLAATPAARSWPWLGPGVAVLLLPSLLATIDERPVWRLVALGVVGVAVVTLAVVLRLQAPFLIGVAVVMIHGIATFAPQIRAVYELADWWLWAGLGGVLLVALAIRYEHRIRNLRSAVSTIAALR